MDMFSTNGFNGHQISASFRTAGKSFHNSIPVHTMIHMFKSFSFTDVNRGISNDKFRVGFCFKFFGNINNSLYDFNSPFGMKSTVWKQFDFKTKGGSTQLNGFFTSAGGHFFVML